MLRSWDWLAFVLVIVGGLNWLLVGLLDFNLVSFLFGSVPVVERIVYVLVGVAALYLLWFLARVEREVPTHRRVTPRTPA